MRIHPSPSSPSLSPPDPRPDRPRRPRARRRTRAVAALGVAVLVLTASGCWRLADTRELVLWTTVGVPIQVCNDAVDDDLEVGAHMTFVWGDETQDSSSIEWDRWDGHCYWHAYSQPGTYQGAVRMTPGHETEGEQRMTITVAPAAGHLRTSGTGPTHRNAWFSASGLAASTMIPGRSTPAPVHHWDFGDGTTAVTSAATTSHTYATPGTYEARVTVTRAFDYDLMTMFHEAYAWSTTTVRVGS